MTLRQRLRAIAAAAALSVALASVSAHAVPREQMMNLAEAYAAHAWLMTSANLTASCAPGYQSVFAPNTTVVGVAYKWGGFDSLAGYDSKLAQGHGAGSYPSDGVLSCVTGVDCSGYVSRCWGRTQKYGTATIHQISHLIGVGDLRRGDAMNEAGYHIVLWDRFAGNGAPLYYEANMPKVIYNAWSTWGYLSTFTPIRYDNVTETSPGPTPEPHIIVIDELPYHDARSTLEGVSLWDAYSCAPNTNESGPEISYLLDLDAPGTLTATISDGPGVDVDVHLLTALDPDTCLARGHISVGPMHLPAGSYVIVVDSWTNASGVVFAGAYTLDVTFTPDPGTCASGACGLVCGGCPAGEVCEAGQCEGAVQLEPCGEVSYEGECDGAVLFWCSDTGLQGGVCQSGCCGWVPSMSYYDCYEPAQCGTCQHECAAGTHGCSQGGTHAWTCEAASSAGACRTRSWTPCADGCDVTTGLCAGDDVCSPQCGGKNCGPDACGGICGTCSSGLTCDGGQCVAACSPSCAGKVCGPDGCGGSCGACGAGSACVAGQCQAGCTASCAGRACGDDGCGGSCGTCPAGGSCDDGVCMSTCAPQCGGRACGPDGCGGQCGFCAGGSACVGGQCDDPCTPSCAGRACGDDGCGGSCGACPGDQACAPSGQCAASSDPGPSAGEPASSHERAAHVHHHEAPGAGCAGAEPAGPAGVLIILLALALGRSRRRSAPGSALSSERSGA